MEMNCYTIVHIVEIQNIHFDIIYYLVVFGMYHSYKLIHFSCQWIVSTVTNFISKPTTNSISKLYGMMDTINIHLVVLLSLLAI